MGVLGNLIKMHLHTVSPSISSKSKGIKPGNKYPKKSCIAKSKNKNPKTRSSGRISLTIVTKIVITTCHSNDDITPDNVFEDISNILLTCFPILIPSYIFRLIMFIRLISSTLSEGEGSENR